MNTITVYGISNCDIIKKTLNWFKRNGIAVAFHDYKKSSIQGHKLADWIGQAGLDSILNKRSTTWKQLPLKVQQEIKGIESAIELMIKNTSIIRRPIIESGNKLIAGYDEAVLTKSFYNS